MRHAPCMNCPDRYPGCHSLCQREEYLEEREWREKIKAGRRQEFNRFKQSAHWDAKHPVNHNSRERNK